ncbi:hypothetical protein W97_02194 [Coniosporium apollinis CBS 100218]|uniref:Fucose-specific lectin n=1 Tax=Coniosporium apollinis (strain CBS 100218) TaxID=1168221 RepID=R7YM73_CONA1|nr:uncharacterized protein W97_02194 [Coniosporium apollinis CBS 100218]EON62968.1 hypothetical protein W97_02194 [Coniosporium apollinis CBS 100218]
MSATRVRRPPISRKLALVILTALALLALLALSLGLGLGFGLKPDPPRHIPPDERYGGSLPNTSLALLGHPYFESLLYGYVQHESGDVLELVYSGGEWYGGNSNVTVLPRDGLNYKTAEGEPRYVPGPRMGTGLVGVWYGDDLRSLFYISSSSHLQEIYTDAPYNFQEAWRWYPRNTGGVSLYDLQLLASPTTALAACSYAIDNSTSEVRLFYGGDDGRVLQAGLRNGGWEYLGPIHGGQAIRMGEVEVEPTAKGGLACTSGNDFAGLILYHYGVAGKADEAEGGTYFMQSVYSAETGEWKTALASEMPAPASDTNLSLPLAAISGTLASAANTTADTIVYALPAQANDTATADPSAAAVVEPSFYFRDLTRGVGDVGASNSNSNSRRAISPAAAILIAALQEIRNSSAPTNTASVSSASAASALSPGLLTRGSPLHQAFLPGTGLAAAWVSDEGGGGRELLVLFRNGSAILSQTVGGGGGGRVERVPVMRAGVEERGLGDFP